ncbi:MAG: pyridoxamine 5'-phosphate oxidase family protein [bacterium]|nr:pyridoxamine 5'-phosphate oxidase family protein [bacterium]
MLMPTRMRPGMHEYGISGGVDGMLEWAWVDAKLRDARNYWIASTRPNGRPHSAPVWAVWIDGVLYFGSEKTSVKVRNISANPYISVHLESGDEVVILEGRAVLAAPEPGVLDGIAAEYTRKYAGYSPTADDLRKSMIFVFRPETALAWIEQDFPRTATKFVFAQTAPQPG